MIQLLFLILTSTNSYAAPADFSPGEYKGKVIYLDFWASWCEPCKESFPWLNKMKKKYPGLEVVGVNLDKENDKAKDFLKRHPADFKVIYDPEAKYAKKYEVKGMPYSLIFDKNGNIKHKHIGYSKDRASNYEREIKELIGAK